MPHYVADLLRRGGAIVYTSPETSVADAVQKMGHHNVGSILILENSRKLLGIFTERDLLRRVVLAERDPAKTLIGDVMSTNVIVVAADTPRAKVLSLMEEHHIRHIPVADADQLLGVISLRDVLRFDNKEKDFEIEQLKEYVLKKPYPSYPG